MDEVYRRRQLDEGGSDPFEDVDAPEGDPSLSAAGSGEGDADAVMAARALRHRKHAEYHAKVRPADPDERV